MAKNMGEKEKKMIFFKKNQYKTIIYYYCRKFCRH
jgi:hypothetical protein